MERIKAIPKSTLLFFSFFFLFLFAMHLIYTYLNLNSSQSNDTKFAKLAYEQQTLSPDIDMDQLRGRKI